MVTLKRKHGRISGKKKLVVFREAGEILSNCPTVQLSNCPTVLQSYPRIHHSVSYICQDINYDEDNCNE
jgi:hypothetical protein